MGIKSDRAYRQEYMAILKACSDFGFSDTDDVPLSAIVRAAFSTLTTELAAVAQARDTRQIISNDELILLRECVRSLDCGQLYCRYCHAGTDNQWRHTEHCPYADSVTKAEHARAILDRLQGVEPVGPLRAPRGTPQTEKDEDVSTRVDGVPSDRPLGSTAFGNEVK